ncbi:hypothetical protein [Bradyrhizobium valentinum]|uniref:hypothetical protein n=1 Tax=Bradyrhizobium valentinum TaxID=1518501 RepID=UPI001FDA7413|nr:hypothetical protein [Bradyrhizobium valentinum]
MMFGAYATWYLHDVLDWPYALAVLGAVAAVSVLGYVSDRALFQFTRGNLVNGLLVSIGMISAFEALVLTAFTTIPKDVSYVLPGALNVARIVLRKIKLVVCFEMEFARSAAWLAHPWGSSRWLLASGWSRPVCFVSALSRCRRTDARARRGRLLLRRWRGAFDRRCYRRKAAVASAAGGRCNQALLFQLSDGKCRSDGLRSQSSFSRQLSGESRPGDPWVTSGAANGRHPNQKGLDRCFLTSMKKKDS